MLTWQRTKKPDQRRKDQTPCIVAQLAAVGQTFSQEMSGGNPDEFFRAETINSSYVLYAHMNSSFVYDPMTDPLDSVDFSFDALNFSSNGNAGMGFGLAVEQSGSLFTGPVQNSKGALTFDWENFLQSGLVESDFAQQTGSANLDFSSGGAPLTFGFFTTNSHGTGIIAGYDNYAVTVNAVPEPSSWLLLFSGCALVGLCVGRHRRGRRAKK